MTQMNTRLEIASRLMAGWSAAKGDRQGDEVPALKIADRLIAEEARTRPPAADAPAPDDLRAVAEELMKAVELYASLHGPGVVDCEFIQIHKERGWNGVEDRSIFRENLAAAALTRARDIGLGGGK